MSISRSALQGLKLGAGAATALLLAVGCARAPTPPTAVPEGTVEASRSAPERSRLFMVSTANPYASRVAREVLMSGGGAIDAAVAAQLVLNLVEPQSSGIGGGAFLLHYSAESGEIDAYDGRETAPEAASATMFMRPDRTPRSFPDAAIGGLAVGVPGLVRMLELAHRAHGRLDWARLFAPAIALAEEGFAVSPRLHGFVAGDEYLRGDAAAAAYFYGADGVARPVGSILRNPAFAATLRAIARDGADAFYEGAIATAIVRAVQGFAPNPGRMRTSDLARYRAKRRPPLCAPYRQWLVCGMPPPTSGGITVLQILGMLERFELGALAPQSAITIHLITEASRLAYADRNAYIADEDFVAVPKGPLLDPRYLAARAGLISPARSLGTARPGLEEDQATGTPPAGDSPRGVSTTHLSIVDGDGDVVAMTSSIETVFGSRLMVGGFLLNNQLTDFSFRPEVDGRPVANRVEAGKRPRSSMAPSLVFDGAGRFVMAIGSPGGARIIPYVAKTIIGVLDWGLDIQTAIDLPNFTNLNGATDLEEGTALTAVVRPLESKGHTVRLRPLVSGLHGIVATDDGGLEGGADGRREGLVLGE